MLFSLIGNDHGKLHETGIGTEIGVREAYSLILETIAL